MVRKTVHRTENNNLLLQPAMLETRLQTPHDGTEDGAAPYAGDAGIALVAGKAGILHFFAGSTSDGCKPPVHLQIGQVGEAPRIPAQLLIRKVDIELMLKSKPHERMVPKESSNQTTNISYTPMSYKTKNKTTSSNRYAVIQ